MHANKAAFIDAY